MDKPLVSIIIPTYNRAHLIGETLDSILAQTYENWECIIVDDGSKDNTDEVVNDYINRDDRFIYFKRPESNVKGANACRNIGLEKCVGEFVIFFDSDDLMTVDHLSVKYERLVSENFDFVIARTKYFNHENKDVDRFYKFLDHPITTYDYISQKINWLTLDAMIKCDLAKHFRFNENLQSGQEYNYFCKLVSISTHASFIDKIVSLRRYHAASIRASLKTKSQLNESRFNTRWFTYLDLKDVLEIKSKIHLLQVCIDFTFKERKVITKQYFLFLNEVFKTFGSAGFYFLLMLACSPFGRGYYFRNKLLKF